VPAEAEIERIEIAEPETRWTAWAGRGLMAALEQGSVSGSNFVLSVALARWLAPAEYGAYAVAFSMLLLGAASFQAVFLMPLMVHVPRLDRAQRAGYLRALLRMQAWGFATLFAAGAAVCVSWAAMAEGFPLRLALASIFTTGALTFQWLLRDSHYLTLSPAAPARGSMVYSVALMAGLLALSLTGAAADWTAVLVMGVAAMAGGLSQIPALLVHLRDPDPGIGLADVWRASRRLGRWEFWISLAGWAPVHLTFPVTAGLLGPGATGALRALQNFAMPLNQLVVALSRLVLPYLCGRSKGRESPLVQGRRIAWVALTAGSAYTAALWLVAGAAVHLLYGGAYDEHAWLMPLAILPMAFWGGAQSLGLALRAAGRFPAVLIGSISAGLGFAAAVIPATKAFGLTGALGAAAAAQLLGLVLLALFSRAGDEPAGTFSPVPADGGGV
jgi:O-antigen/teichoic acid export membrane protein